MQLDNMKIKEQVPVACHELSAQWHFSPTSSPSLKRRAQRGEHWWTGGGHGATSVPSRAPPVGHSPSSAGASDSIASPLKRTNVIQQHLGQRGSATAGWIPHNSQTTVLSQTDFTHHLHICKVFFSGWVGGGCLWIGGVHSVWREIWNAYLTFRQGSKQTI